MRRCIDTAKRPATASYIYHSCRQISAHTRASTQSQHAPFMSYGQEHAPSNRAAQRHTAEHSRELQVSLQQWAGLESRWRRLDRGSGGGGGSMQTRTFSTLHQKEEAAEPSTNANRKNERDAVEPADAHTRLHNTPGWIETADLIKIASLFSESPDQCCALETLPMLLHRIAVLHPPTHAAQQQERQPARSRSPRSMSNKDAGVLVRALLAHTKQHLSSLDTALLAEIFAAASKLSYLHGMHLWFSQGGAGGMGIRSLQVLATRASDVPAAQVASLISALGRLSTGEQVHVYLSCVYRIA